MIILKDCYELVISKHSNLFKKMSLIFLRKPILKMKSNMFEIYIIYNTC